MRSDVDCEVEGASCCFMLILYEDTCSSLPESGPLRSIALCGKDGPHKKQMLINKLWFTENLPICHQSLSQRLDVLWPLPESACIIVWRVFRHDPACSILHNGLEYVVTGICGQPAPNTTFKVWRRLRRPPQAARPHLLVVFQQRACDERLYATRVLLRHYLCPGCVQASYGTGKFCRMPIQYHAFLVELFKGFPTIETRL